MAEALRTTGEQLGLRPGAGVHYAVAPLYHSGPEPSDAPGAAPWTPGAPDATSSLRRQRSSTMTTHGVTDIVHGPDDVPPLPAGNLMARQSGLRSLPPGYGRPLRRWPPGWPRSGPCSDWWGRCSWSSRRHRRPASRRSSTAGPG
ncbi:hypothetical protein HBB16_08310 [Pseudonocardia sp. MCCB 268]|nr:hypothetical protein [Pseudonocardia cytotoxica]